ncbi:MAG: FAD-binding oxidoreductase [Xanthomonadales bacterium]|jgi:D-amino-acid dehydrogenase|nr:FAD-binding oxidoreductase [Xanthomonadales bacterium]
MNETGAQPGERCIVIGAGTVGACCAWHLTAAGFRVTLIDRAAPGQATSFGNAACISPSHIVPFSYPGVWKKIPGWLRDPLGPLTIRWRHLPWVGPWLWGFWRAGSQEGVQAAAEAQAALMHHVIEDFHALLSRTNQLDLVVSRGALQVYERPGEFEADRWMFDLEAELGFPWKALTREEVADYAPALDPGSGQSLYLPSWQNTVNPGRMTAGIAEAAIADGAEWVQDEVSDVTARPDRVIVDTVSGRRLEADRLVLAAGPWSNRLAARLDQAVPMTAKRGYHAMIPDPGVSLELPVISGTRSFVITPLEDGLRLAGTAEFARLDAEADYRRSQVLVGHAKRYLPGLHETGASEWMGQRPMMVDSVPIISTSPRHHNVVYAFGHGHYGLTQGATTGRLIVDLVRGDEPGLDMRPYRIDRF